MSYEQVSKIVPGLHGGNFKYIVHLGVGRNGFITLEKCAYSGGYYRKDINGCTGPMDGRLVYITRWNIHRLVEQLHEHGVKVFLCGMG